jgi:hypothetical protein
MMNALPCGAVERMTCRLSLTSAGYCAKVTGG